MKLSGVNMRLMYVDDEKEISGGGCCDILGNNRAFGGDRELL
jgi:hypothetical protein